MYGAIVEADTINTFKNRLDKYLSVFLNFNADLIGTESLCESDVKTRAKSYGMPAPVRTHWIGLDWIDPTSNRKPMQQSEQT